LKADVVNDALTTDRLESALASDKEASVEAHPDAAADVAVPLWEGLRLAGLDMDLRLGSNHLKADGALGARDDALKLDLAAPDLAAFWPELPGGAQLQGEVSGALGGHKADLSAQYTPAQSKKGEVGSAPVKAHVVIDGHWGQGASEQDTLEG